MVWLWPVLATAAPATPEAIDELLHESGLWQQLTGISAQFVQGIEADLGRLGVPDERASASLRAAFTTAYSADRLRKNVAKALASELSAEDTATALAWLATDLGKRVTKLEEDASTAAPPDRSAEIAGALPPERRALYTRLARATYTGEVGATIALNVAYGLARGMAGARSGSFGGDTNQLRAVLEASRPKLVAMIETQAIGSSAVTYATLSDEDIEQYIAFAESPVGRRYHAATSIALDKAMTESAVEAGRLLASGQST
jgi:hypothetical protein